jgi:hypothetical protein
LNTGTRHMKLGERIPSWPALPLYLLISIMVFGLPVIGSLPVSHVGYMTDPAMMMWCMAWWPYALGHGMNPFVTHAVWAPGGFNLAWSASVPALAAVLSPVTLVWGPVVSYNICAILTPALSGWAAFLLCRHIMDNFGGAFAGGLLYGFSPYEVGQALAGHLNLSAVFLPPLCVLLVLLLVQGIITPWKFTIALAVALVIQCLISTEVLATMTLFGTLAMLGAISLMPVYRRRLARAIVPIGCAYAGAALVLSPFLYYVFAKNAVPPAPIFPASLFSADLLSLIVPGRLMLIYPHAAAALDVRLSADINFLEKGSYYSLPLLAIGTLYFWRRRGQSDARLLLVLLALVVLASLGPVLHIAGSPVIPLPEKLLGALPLIRNALPIRFANYGFLIFAIIVGFYVSGPRAPLKGALAVAMLIALLPTPLLLGRQNRYDSPAFFAKGLYRDYLRPGENVLVIPYGATGPSMAWQAGTWMYFRMPGGYLGFTPEEYRRWPIVNTLLTSLPVPEPRAQLKAFIYAHNVNAIVVESGATGVAPDAARSLGLVPVKVGGVELYRQPQKIADPVMDSLSELQQSAAEAWFRELLCAAHRFLAGGRSSEELSPVKAHELGYLPDSRWGETLGRVLAGARHGVFNGLWVGPGQPDTVALGLFASPAAAAPLVSRYRHYASSILYPYPHEYPDGAVPDDSVDFLLMNLPRSVVLQLCSDESEHH